MRQLMHLRGLPSKLNPRHLHLRHCHQVPAHCNSRDKYIKTSLIEKRKPRFKSGVFFW